MKLNFSLIFVLPVFYFCGYRFGFLILVLRMIFALSLSGFHLVAIVNQSILLVYELIVILLMYLYSFIYQNVSRRNWKLFMIALSTIVSIAMISAIINALVFFPIYIAAYSGFHIPPTINAAIFHYENYRIAFFNLPNYWWGVISTYCVANLIKFSLIFLIYWPLSEVFHHFKTTSHHY